MKVSNETKIGLLALIVIAAFIVGFNFLKGKNVFGRSTTLYAKFSNIQGLSPSNPVIINGMQVGIVKEVINDRSMKDLTVVFSIDKNIDIPSNSVAVIIPNPLTQTRVEIKLGNSKTMLKNNDNINTEPSGAFLEDVFQKVDPVVSSVNGAVKSLDTLIQKVSLVIDANNKNNIDNTLANMNRITASILSSTASLEKLLSSTNGPIAGTLNNVNEFTKNLNTNNDKINSILKSLDKTTATLSTLQPGETIQNLNEAVTLLKNSIAKMNSNEGTIGLLMNDPSLYRNISATSNKLNLLLDDMRTNPKRYVSISVFGKKPKGVSLTQPLPDTINAPYLPK